MRNPPTDKFEQLRKKAEELITKHPERIAEFNSNEISNLVQDISVYQVELELQNEELRRSNQLLEKTRDSFIQLYNQAPVGYLTLSAQGIIMQCNQTFCELIQDNSTEIMGKPLADLMTSDYRQIFLSRFNAILKNPQDKSIDVCFLRKDGSRIFCQLTSREFHNESIFSFQQTTDATLLVIVDDIDERKKMEEALIRSETRLEQAQAVAQFGNWELDITDNRVWASEQAFNIFGLERNEPYISLDEARKIYVREDVPMVEKALEDLIKENHEYDIEFRIKRPDNGELRVIHTIAELIRDEKNNPIKVVGVIQDISERKAAEEALRQSELNFRALFEQAAVGVAVTDAHTGEFLKINERFCQILGYSAEELTGNLFKNITHPDDVEISVTKMKEMLAGYIQEFVLEKRYLHKNGKTIWTSINVAAMWEKGETPTSYVAIVMDITEQKRIQEELHRSEKKYRSVFQTATDAIITADMKGNIIAWNNGAKKMFQYAENEILGKPLTLLIPEEFIEKHLESIKQLAKNGESNLRGKTVEISAKRKDQTVFPIEMVLSFWEEEEKIFFTSIIRDITERKRFEEKLQYQSTHDILTGLYNRQYYETEISRLQKSRLYPVTIIVMDMDGLKNVNDTCGHMAGDQFLIQIANIFREVFRSEDMIARIGGDEFVAVLNNTSEDCAEKMIKRLRSRILSVNQQQKMAHKLNLSIGMATSINKEMDLEHLFHQADQAMYEQKKNKKMLE